MGESWPRGLKVVEVLAVVGVVASPLTSETEDYVSQEAAGAPGGVGAERHIWCSHPKPLRRDCNGQRDDDLRSVRLGSLLTCQSSGPPEEARVGRVVVSPRGSRWRGRREAGQVT
jgi:hypothetical protein